ncbi:hypothetical protein MASR1M32_34640 [Rhodobacter sp.]
MTTTALPRAAARRRVERMTMILRLIGLSRQRKSLARLDARLLRDIGITATEARSEADRPVWDVPAHWRS